jgi:thioesterase domain-containing protein
MACLLAEVAGLERGKCAEARLVRLAPPAPPRPNTPAGPWRFVLSAREHGLLRRTAEELIGVLRSRPGIRADDLARTLAERERQRVAVEFTARDLGEVRAALTEFLITGTVEADPAQGTPDPVALRHARRVTLPPRPPDQTRYRAGPPPLPTGPRPAPEDASIEVLRTLRTQLGEGDLGMHDEFEAVGGDPALAAQAAAALSARFSAPLTGPDVLTLGSAARIAAHLEPDAPRVPRRVSVLTRLRAGTPGRDVFLVHPAGGNVFCYHNLLRHSREPGTVWGLGFPADRLRELRTVPALTRAYVQAIRRVRPRGPYLLGGYSFGGVVAFEMARTLQAQGERVDNLLLMDVPQPVTRPPAGEREFLAAVPELARCVLSLEPAAVEPPADFDAAVELLRRPEWSETVAEEYRRVLRILWLNYRALSGYRCRADGALRAPATLLRAEEPTPAPLRRLGLETGRTDLWAERFEPAPRLLDVPGDHYSMFHDAAHLRTLAARFDEALALRPVAVSPVR